MEFTVRKIRTKIFTGSPSDVEEQVNVFLNTIEQLNYVDIKVTTSDVGRISVVVVYKVVQKL
ncbi:sporulation protein Cse60 [Neobacillus mesonae]|uniref:sporulation protein Cse60 n=1 Tax=Neobacillus mesonae TaxID=1193713 RepID=UPI00203F511A|nr:sporulation protein cse60 [Neobacillus mesonae]MCM3569950.1 sporulation protein cse60 [Neobacillus mesonae]